MINKVLCFVAGMGAMFIIAYLVGKENLKQVSASEVPTIVEPIKDSVITTCPHCGYKVSVECNESNTTFKNL